MLSFGLWMLLGGLRFREDHQEAEAVVVGTPVGKPRKGRQPKMDLRLRYEIDGTSYEIPAPPARKGKSGHSPGARVAVWYPKGNPQAADAKGDRGTLLGGIAFTGGGVLFLLVGALAAVAEFYPNRYIQFG
jgi:hypothetical protein